MDLNQKSLLEYFNYNLETLLNEFNNYYITKSPTIPIFIQTLYLYFSHLAENSLQLLIKNKFNYQNALDILNTPNIYQKPYTQTEIQYFLRNYQHNPQIFYGLVGFPLYFFVFFLKFIKYNDDKDLNLLLKNIPIIENNLNMIRQLIV